MSGRIVLNERDPSTAAAYAAGLRIACDVLEYRTVAPGWWALWPWWSLRGEMRRGIASLRAGADLIEANAGNPIETDEAKP